MRGFGCVLGVRAVCNLNEKKKKNLTKKDFGDGNALRNVRDLYFPTSLKLPELSASFCRIISL